MSNEILRPQQEITKLKYTVYLAGPCARDENQERWQDKAIEILNRISDDIVIVDPTNLQANDTKEDFDWTKESDWEYECMWRADKIIFWVPRDLDKMPGFTTNVEFGYWIGKFPHKVIYGRPDNASKTEYLDWLFHKERKHTAIYNNLEVMLLDLIQTEHLEKEK